MYISDYHLLHLIVSARFGCSPIAPSTLAGKSYCRHRLLVEGPVDVFLKITNDFQRLGDDKKARYKEKPDKVGISIENDPYLSNIPYS